MKQKKCNNEYDDFRYLIKGAFFVKNSIILDIKYY